MAKAPRRRSGSGGRDRRGGDKPPAAKPVRPVKPAAVQPVQPVKPVQPIKPVQPVRPAKPAAAKPVRPPVAPPVAKPVAAKPIAKPVAASPQRPARSGGAPAKRVAEQEVGRRGGRAPARGGSGRGGMGIGAKVGLIAALVTFLVVALTVFAGSSGGGGDEAAEFNAFGYTAASVLTAPDARWWRGTAGSGGSKGLGSLEKRFKTLLGKKGAEFWDKRIKELSTPPPRDMNDFEKMDLEKDQTRFQKEVGKLSGGSAGPTGAKYVHARLSQVWNAMASGEKDRYMVHSAWVRDAGDKEAWLAGNVNQDSVQYAAGDWDERGAGYASIEGKIDGTKVRIFKGYIRGVPPTKPMLAFVAVTDNGSKGGGGAALGMAMLLLGPLLVGFAAYSIAGAHSKNVRTLAREIDRLGSSGDPERTIRAHGAEASAIARSVERMVSNLEFREKHEGADLDEVVSREQKVAEEIHGALIAKNPPRLQDYEVETLFKPGFEIGGDHFEYFRVDDDHLGLMLLDTNVRGVPAALVMSATRSYVRAAAPGVLSPAEVLKRVNRHLAGELPAGRHVTALYVVLNQSDGSATIASAGHLPLLVYRHQAGKMAKVNPEGIAMGMDRGPVFDDSLQEGDIPMGLGDRIVMYTDGALRIQNAEGDEFGEARFHAAVTAEAPKNSQAFVNFVGAAIDRFHLEVPQNDDITISTIKRLR